MDRIESFSTIIRWKAHFFDKKERPVSNMNFGLETNFTPQEHELSSPFESGFYDMIPSINFKPIRSDFQKKLPC